MGIKSLIVFQEYIFFIVLFLFFGSNPFLILDPAPIEGVGLNPLLQDPGLVFHPPFLYLGYVGLSIVWSFIVLIKNDNRFVARL